MGVVNIKITTEDRTAYVHLDTSQKNFNSRKVYEKFRKLENNNIQMVSFSKQQHNKALIWHQALYDKALTTRHCESKQTDKQTNKKQNKTNNDK